MFRRVFLIGALLIASVSYYLSSNATPATEPPTPWVVGRNGTVLFITNQEHGLSNVHIATAASLLEEWPGIDIHFASFETTIGDKLGRVDSHVRTRNPSAREATYHQLDGYAYKAAFEKALNLTQDSFIAPPATAGIETLVGILKLLSPWDVDDHLHLYHQIRALIDELDPAVVALDTLLTPAADAVRSRNRAHVFITPQTVVDRFVAAQPRGQLFWKYPA